MFVSKEHQPQVLPREAYTDPERCHREIETLLRPAWHAVALMDEMPKDGSYLTFELLGQPLILWNRGGDVHCFLNVCTHRFSKLACGPCGAAERLECQYHGWQFDQTGNIRHIPDAKSFRPLTKGTLGLKKFRAERCGELVFVNLSDEGPSLQEFLGEKFSLYESWFTPEMQTATVVTRTIDANWKCLVENALETYHTGMVHPKTFGYSPKEEDCEHHLHDDWTGVTVDFSHEREFRTYLDKFGHLLVGRQREPVYQHFLHYPNVMMARLSLYRWVECVVPVGPNQAVSIVRLMCHVGEKGKLRRLWNRYIIPHWANQFLSQVGAEDAGIVAEMQKGLLSPEAPAGGLLSTREERVFHFQRYIDQAMQSERTETQRETIPLRYSGNDSP